MKSIAVLIDFTPGCQLALQQAHILAQRTQATLSAVHVIPSGKNDGQAADRVRAFTEKAIGSAEFRVIAEEGRLMSDIGDIVAMANPDLVVLCTHGIKGIVQALFGAHVLKLVQHLPYPCLVVQENTRVRPDGIRRILFPASPFPDFEEKMKQTGALAQAFGATIVMYEIDKYLADTEDIIASNQQKAEAYFSGIGVSYVRVREDNTVFSMGYTKQTLKYAVDNGIDAISVMSAIQDADLVMLRADKEALLTNDAGIPVLCCC